MFSFIQFERKGNVFCRCQQEKQEKVLSLLTNKEAIPNNDGRGLQTLQRSVSLYLQGGRDAEGDYRS